MTLRRLRAQRQRGRAHQPRFDWSEVVASWLGALLAITVPGLIGGWSHDPLVVAPFGASTAGTGARSAIRGSSNRSTTARPT